MIPRLGTALAALALAGSAAGQDAPLPQPQDKDERGLWMQVDDYERELRRSSFVIEDPALNAYVKGVFCRTVGQAGCAATRLYILRTAYFNASMAPNGMMLVYSGLFLRARNEAQLAAVLGHEYTHFQGRHSLRNFRDAKSKTAALAWLSVVPVASYGAYAALSVAQLGLIASIFSYSREMESAADAGSVPLLVHAGYDPRQAAAIWEQVRAEQDATAEARHKRSRKDRRGMFDTHPGSAERMVALRALADRQPVTVADDGGERYRRALAAWWPALIDDQIKLNDFGATEYLIGYLADAGWTPELLYARGELYRARGRPEDLTAAASFYARAVALPEAPPEAWKGLGLALLRSGHQVEGQAALRDYLAKRPAASDRAMLASLAGAAM